jgi:hypothetical protein
MDGLFVASMIQKLDQLIELVSNQRHQATVAVIDESDDENDSPDLMITKKELEEIFQDQLNLLREKNITTILEERLSKQQQLQGQRYKYALERKAILEMMRYQNGPLSHFGLGRKKHS